MTATLGSRGGPGAAGARRAGVAARGRTRSQTRSARYNAGVITPLVPWRRVPGAQVAPGWRHIVRPLRTAVRGPDPRASCATGGSRRARAWHALGGVVGAGLLGVLLVLTWPAASARAAASAAQVAQMDEEVIAAREALRTGNEARLAAAVPRVAGHPLEPWVRYWHLRVRLESADAAEVQAFLAAHAGTLVADRLRADWLKLLGRRGQWAAFAAERPRLASADTEIECYALSARREAGEADAARHARRFWFTGRDLPESCTPLFQALVASGELRADDVWARIRLALEAGSTGTARRAAAFLPGGQPFDPKALDLAHDRPQAVLERRNELRTRAQREVVMFAAHRLARTSPQMAASAWDRIDHQFGEAERAYTWGAIAWLGARRLEPEAPAWFRRAAGVPLNDEKLAWRVRASLRAGEWRDVLAAIEQMSAQAREDSAWRYWRARALRELGRGEEATGLLVALSREFGFYGQLAGEDLGPFAGPPSSPAFRPVRDEVEAFGRHPAVARALAFYRIRMRLEGNLEWSWALRGMNDAQLLTAAEYARGQRLWDRAIATAERTREQHDFSLRFLAPFREELQPHLRQQQLDEAWVLGLIRQESRFLPDVRSHAGASGLMQLMPATAAMVAKRSGMADFRPALVNDVQINLGLGTAYLRQVLDGLDDSPVLASAAYNAGPGRARAWRTVQPLEAAIYAESIPFGETRDYVKRVMSNATWYAHVLGHSLTSLRARIGTIPARQP